MAVEGAELLCHAENGAGAEFEWRFVDNAEDAGQAFIRRGGLIHLE